MNRRAFLTTVAATGCAMVAARPLFASSHYPSRLVKIVVPFPAGGGTDVLARHLAKQLGDDWAQPVIVENVPGAGGGVGAVSVAKATADGHTLLMTTAGVSSINVSLYKNLSYDPERQFAPISRVASTVFAVVVNPAVKAQSIPDLIAQAKANPGKLTYGSAGYGAAGHLPTELFKRMAGVDLLHVPYKGTAPALNDLLSGQIDVMFAILGPVMPFIEANKVRVLATTGAQRTPALPDVPTVAEAGVPDYVADEWWGIAAPANTPPDVITAINAGIKDFVSKPDIQARLIRDGFAPVSDTPDEFARLISADKVKWGNVIREAKVSFD